MEDFDSLVFDLDGTLWDTCGACAIAWNNVLRRNGIEFRAIVADDVRRVTGKPHEQCIREAFAGLSELDLRRLIEETAAEDNRVIREIGGVLYDGVEAGLQGLAGRYPLFIVSNCQSGYIETFFDFSGFGRLFRDYECWGDTGEPKSENLSSIIARNGLARGVFIGDTEGDRVAARSCGIPFFHAEYGFGAVADRDFGFSAFSALVDRVSRSS